MKNLGLIACLALTLSACAQLDRTSVEGSWTHVSEDAVTLIELKAGGVGEVRVLDGDGKLCRSAYLVWELSGASVRAKELIPDEIAEVWIKHEFKLKQFAGKELLESAVYGEFERSP